MCWRHTRSVKALCLDVRVREHAGIAREKGLEDRREGTDREREREKEREGEGEGEGEGDIRMQRDGYPAFRYYDHATMRRCAN